MNNNERDNFINNEAAFRGYVLATLDNIKNNSTEFHDELSNHLRAEMIELKEFNTRLAALENWKLKVTAMSGTISVVLTFIINYFIK